MKTLAAFVGLVLVALIAVPATGAEGTSTPQRGESFKKYRPLAGYWDLDHAEIDKHRYFEYEGRSSANGDCFKSYQVTAPNRSGQRSVIHQIGRACSGSFTPHGSNGFYEWFVNPNARGSYYSQASQTLIVQGDTLTIHKCVPAAPTCVTETWRREK